MTPRRYVPLLALLGAVSGLLLALADPRQYGGGHKCPGGAPKASCFYPPDLTAQRILWAVLGLVIGLVVSYGVWVVQSLRDLA
jgi:hypothetical protein